MRRAAAVAGRNTGQRAVCPRAGKTGCVVAAIEQRLGEQEMGRDDPGERDFSFWSEWHRRGSRQGRKLRTPAITPVVKPANNVRNLILGRAILGGFGVEIHSGCVISISY